MRLETTALPDGTRYTLYKEKLAVGTGVLCGTALTVLEIDPAWRRRGYGSYLLKELLRGGGGYARGTASIFTAPLPAPENAAALALAAKFGFAENADHTGLCRRRMPDLTAVALCHRFLSAAVPPGGLYLDATCGNGHDTLFLAQLAGANGRVIALDIQRQAVDATNALLAAHGLAQTAAAHLADHQNLLQFTAPGTADCVLFNFGWLPGAAHTVHSEAGGSIPALRAGLQALRPGGVLAAVLYSGKIIGEGEKQAALAFFKSLPLAAYTVLVCDFANWADTAPLPCFVLKKSVSPP